MKHSAEDFYVIMPMYDLLEHIVNYEDNLEVYGNLEEMTKYR